MEIIFNILNPAMLLFMTLGVGYGIIFGSIPGLSSSVAVALMIPLTYAMEPMMAISFIVAIYVGGVSGGLISAILLRIPGTPSSVVTTFDGYPMAQKGQAGKALGIGISASVFGGLFSSFALLFLAPALAKLTIKFGPFDYFGVTVFSLSLVCMLLEGRVLKGILATLLGLILSFVGTSPIDGKARFTFGNHNIDNGFNVIVVIIGVFAISEMLHSVGKKNQTEKTSGFSKESGFFPSFKEYRSYFPNMIRSSFIGTIIGILPGLSGPSAAMISYTQAKRSSKTPEEFGKGCPEGLVASETSNNAVSGGALIPMLALGIPGNAVAAIIMGGFIIHGVTVGPMLFSTEPVLVKSIIFGFFVANFIMLILESFAIKWFVKILSVPKQYLYPIIIVFCVIGVSSINNRSFDTLSMLAFGLLGYLLEKNDYPLPPLVLGFILGSIVEQNYRRSIMYYKDFPSAISQPSIGAVFFILALFVPLLNFIFSNNKCRTFLHLQPLHKHTLTEVEQ